MSFLKEVHIESCPSEINPHLYVCLNRGRYQLATSKAIYSFSDLYSNYFLSFEALDWHRFNPESVLLLGLGLGSIPEMLTKNFGRQLRYTAVEIDPHIVYLAQKYVISDLGAPVEVQIGDARAYVMQTEREFDLVCMDVFLEDEIPDEMQTTEFLEELAGLLTPTGLLMYNRLARTPDDIRLTRQFLRDSFLRVFPEGGYLDVRGNWMLVSRKDYFDNH